VKQKKIQFSDVESIVIEKGGKVISCEGIKSKDKITIDCGKNHICYTTIANLRRGRWCRKCSFKNRRTVTIEKIKTLVENKGGKLLSDTYIGCHNHLKVACEKGHVWEITYANLSSGKWCRYCSGRLTIKNAQQEALKRGGELLSSTYKNYKDILQWRCSNGHVFYKSLEHVRQNRGFCSKCDTPWRSEEICRNFLEELFEYKFVKYRPSWLRNNNGKQLELDGYCKELNIAFEHNGIYHYKPIKYFNTNKSLDNIKLNDKLKLRLCREHGVKLIVIPALFDRTNINDLPKVIENICIKQNIVYKKNIHNIKFNYSSVSKSTYNQTRLNKAKEVAQLKGGECLSNNYIHVKSKLKWKCSNGHIWFCDYDHVVNGGTWCQRCALMKSLPSKDDIYDMYIKQDLSIKQITKITGRTYNNINCALDLYKIYKKKEKATDIVDCETLYRLYVVESKNRKDIASIYNCKVVTIEYLIKKYKILKYKNMSKGDL
jgi:hypothetical protein